MELLTNLGIGLSTAMSPMNLLYCLAGVFLGTLIGVLPGLGPTATIAMLLPVTFTLPPVSALIMLAGIYYGSQYGGSTTSILVNVPGEAASVVTALDGYQMARKGRAGVALATAAIGSFFAGTVATVILALFAPPLAEIALKFGPAEFFSLMVLGLLASLVLARGSLLHAVGMVVLGLLLGLVGADVNTGTQRFTFDVPQLAAMPRFLLNQTGATALKLVSVCAWPCATVRDGDRTVGFVMPEIPDRFYTEMTTVRGVRRRTAEFQHLLNSPEYQVRHGIRLSDGDRYRRALATLGVDLAALSPTSGRA